MKKSLKTSLNLPESAWSAKLVGSVMTPEIKQLQRFTKHLSQASQHIENTLNDLGTTLSNLDLNAHATEWRKYRRERRELSEAIEKTSDAALLCGGAPARAIRKKWDAQTKGELSVALDNLGNEFLAIAEAPPTAQEREDAARKFIEGLHTWTHADVAAFLTHYVEPEDAYLEAAVLIDKWSEEKLVHTPGPILPTVKHVLDGTSCATADAHKCIGLKAIFTSEFAVQMSLSNRRNLPNKRRAR